MNSENPLDSSIDCAMTRICCFVGGVLFAVVVVVGYALWAAYQNSKQVIDSL